MREIRIDDETNARLEELQAEIRLRTGTSVTQQELLSHLIDGAYESQEDVIDSFRETVVPLSESEKEAMRQGRCSSGVETDEEDIDEILYG